MKTTKLLFILLLAAASLEARAEVAVLVHGYLGTPDSWLGTGVAQTLEARGWRFGGVLPGGATGATGKGRFSYAVSLPSLAPVPVQSAQLAGALAEVAARHPDEPMVLVGHSAGGVVARLALLTGAAPNTKALITIASPHLGTVRAAQALDAVDVPFPVSILPDVFGPPEYHLARASRPLYVDLLPAHPGSLLDWMNRQPHPVVNYVSVVRTAPFALGDELVPAYSQDMNNIPALGGHVKTLVTGAGHGLNPADGVLIADLLDSSTTR